MASVSRRLLHYITSDRSEVNPYNFCVANRTVDGHQHTRGWHVDDLKSSHVNPNNFTKGYKIYSSINDVKAVRGQMHTYLGTILDCSTPAEVVKIDVTENVGESKNFPKMN